MPSVEEGIDTFRMSGAIPWRPPSFCLVQDCQLANRTSRHLAALSERPPPPRRAGRASTLMDLPRWKPGPQGRHNSRPHQDNTQIALSLGHPGTEDTG